MVSETFYGRSVRAACEDGVERAATPRRYAFDGSMAGDNYFAVPAFVRAHGRTVRGFISVADTLDTDRGVTAEYVFRAYTYCKNANAIK